MSAEIIPITTEDISLPGNPRNSSQIDSDLEFMTEVIQNPGLRFRLSELLKTVHIPHHQFHDLGYTTRPITQDEALVNHLNLGHLDKDRQGAIAATVLGACLEIRDEMGSVFEDKPLQSAQGFVAAVPFSIRLLAIAKACSGDTGSAIHPGKLARGDEKRGLSKDYISAKLDISDSKAGMLLDVVSVIHGAKILRDHLSYGQKSENWRVLGDYPDEIIGTSAPREGYFLPDNIETAVHKSRYDLYLLDYWNASWHTEEDRQKENTFREGFEWLCERVAQLASKPEAEHPYWRAYTITSILAHEAFAASTVEGYSGTYDQLVSWEEPMADSAYYPSFRHLIERLKKSQTAFGELDETGVMLAVRGTATRIGRGVEREIIDGNSQPRQGRLRTLGEMYRLLQRHDPDTADQFIATMPLIGTHVQEKADRWQARFS